MSSMLLTSEHEMSIGDRNVKLPELFLFLSVLTLVNGLLILILENAWTITDHFTDLDVDKSFYELPFWKYFLPIQEIYGTWTTTSLVLASLVQQHVHPALVLFFSQ